METTACTTVVFPLAEVHHVCDHKYTVDGNAASTANFTSGTFTTVPLASCQPEVCSQCRSECTSSSNLSSATGRFENLFTSILVSAMTVLGSHLSGA